MGSFAGTGTLLRIALRRDRVRLPSWIVGIALVVAVIAVTLEELYPTVGSRVAIAATVTATPALQAILGPIFDPTSIGGFVAWRMSFAATVLVPLMGLLAVVRHSRAEEEAGRLELLGSTVLGRRAPLTAAVLVAVGASTLLGAAVAAVLVGLGEAPVGSLALGLTYALAGWIFAAVGAVAAQLAESSRGATGVAVAVLGASFLSRGVGDATTDPALRWLTWASPSGWLLQIRPYAGERWALAALCAVVAVALLVLADVLATRRDLGAGLVPTRPGAARAPRWLAGPGGLAWRLHWRGLLGWTAGLFAVGAMYGGVADGVGQMLQDTPQLEEVFRRLGGEEGLVDAFFATTMAVAGLIVSGYVIHTVLRLRAEEANLLAEQVLATAVTRTRWALGHVGVAVAGAAVLLTACGAGAGLTHGLRVGDVGGQVPELVGAALLQLPAVMVLAGLSLGLFGLMPRATGLAWAVLVAFLFVGQLGQLLQLPQMLLNLSPFTHVPAGPGRQLSAEPLAALTAVALALGAAGLVGLRRRDLA